LKIWFPFWGAFGQTRFKPVGFVFVNNSGFSGLVYGGNRFRKILKRHLPFESVHQFFDPTFHTAVFIRTNTALF